MTIPCKFVSAAGNRFVLVDAGEADLPDDPGRWARELRDARRWRTGPPPWPPDGLLVVRPARAGGDDHDCVMEVYNVDGGRPEACGNGLRCVGRYAHDAGLASGRVRVLTDAGLRAVEVEARGGAVVARAWMGAPAVQRDPLVLELEGRRVEATAVSLGNPHCVVFVADEREAPLAAWGRALQECAAFPGGVNVEVASLREPGRLCVRVHERGVGETGACGTGACAAALAARTREARAWPVDVRMPGGELRVDATESGELTLAGEVLEEGAGRFTPSSDAPVAPGRV